MVKENVVKLEKVTIISNDAVPLSWLKAARRDAIVNLKLLGLETPTTVLARFDFYHQTELSGPKSFTF